jgi:prepilin-type N-terminal cleavage/methylation domain-containing protein
MDANNTYNHTYTGFTLIELILSVGVISILLTISVPILQRYLVNNDMTVITNVIVQDIYRAQNLARAGENGGSWGVYIQTGSITVFQGTNYASRNQSKDEVYTIPSSINVTGQNEYVFSAFTGLPVSGGTTTTQNNTTTKSVSVDSNGVVNY